MMPCRVGEWHASGGYASSSVHCVDGADLTLLTVGLVSCLGKQGFNVQLYLPNKYGFMLFQAE